MPLGYNWRALNNEINQMTPLGETDLTIGLVCGWQALSQGLPLNAPALQPNTNQAIVFMTDGFNTANRWNNTLVRKRRDSEHRCPHCASLQQHKGGRHQRLYYSG